MVFEAFGVDLGVAAGHADLEEEGEESFVPLADVAGQSLALGGEEHGAVGCRRDESVPLQAGHRLGDRYVADPEPLGDVDRPGLPGFPDQVIDQLDVVLGEFAGMVGPDARIAGGGWTGGGRG